MGDMGDEYVFKILHETGGAWLVTDDHNREIWLPKSQCDLVGEDDGYVTMFVPEWLAIEKELI